MYRNAAANVDRAIGALRDAVRAHVGREPAVIVLADHGESLFDDGFLGHGYVLNDPQTRIPLVIAGLPVELPTPAMQADVRKAVTDSLVSPSTDQRPRIVPRAERAGVPIPGPLWRARQIAFRDADGLLVTGPARRQPAGGAGRAVDARVSRTRAGEALARPGALLGKAAAGRGGNAPESASAGGDRTRGWVIRPPHGRCA